MKENQEKKRVDQIPPFLEDFLNYLRIVKGLSPSTVKEYAYDLTNFLRFIRNRIGDSSYRKLPLEETPIDDMEASDLERVRLTDLHAYLAYSADSQMNSASRRARKTSSIRSFYKYLVNIGEYFEINPSDKLTTPKRANRNPVYLTLPEALSLIQCAAGQKSRFLRFRDLAILITFLTTGIRLSELCGMNITSIKEDHFTVIGKGNKERTVYMTESCKEALDQYLKVRPRIPDEPALFLSTRQKRISSRAVQHRIDELLIKAGFDPRRYSTHKLRHTAATLMYREGVDIRTLQKILGHASVQTTMIYTHVEDEQVRDGINKNPLAGLDVDEIEGNGPEEKS